MPASAPGRRKGEEQTCALRALNICDNQVVEDPDGRLRVCLCKQERIEEERGNLGIAVRLGLLRRLYSAILDGPLDALAEAELASLEADLPTR